MKTIVIYDQMGEENIQFAVLEGDYSCFDKVFMNSTNMLSDELYDLFYDENHKLMVSLLPEFPREVLVEYPQAPIIVCGFLP